VTATPGQSIHQPPTEPPLEEENEGGRVVLMLLFGLVLLFGGAYVAAYSYAGDNVPRGTSVAGIDIGGRSVAEAQAALQAGLRTRASAPIRVTAGDTNRAVTPGEAGLSVDYIATVAEAGGGQSWDPARLWDYYTGGEEIAPVVDFDGAQMQSLLTELQQDAGHEPVEGAVRFVDGEVRTTTPRPGTEIDPESAGTALQAAYLTEHPVVALELQPLQPEIDESDVQAALNEFANKAVSAPVRLDFGDAIIKLEPADFTPAMTLVAKDGKLAPKVDASALKKAIDAHLGGHGAPVNATVALVDGEPTVIPDKPGVGYDVQQVAKRLLGTVVQDAGDRTLQVKATVAHATFRTADAEKLGITQQVSTFTTYFPYAEYRNINIGRAGELINGTILKPGETFSLNDTVGERTRENGFTEGFIISDGILQEDLGGGVSQMATTTFNAAFFAGLTDIEHKPHSLYFDRYPIGREATVAWGSVDLRFRNDTPYGVLIDVHVTPSTVSSSGVVTVRMFSTKYWDITTKTGTPYDYTDFKTRTLDTPGCHENSGYQGFQIDIWRYFRKAGSSELVKTEKMHTTYIPSDTVICTNPDHT
jgi:vancomycin resistance protein YoaR